MAATRRAGRKKNPSPSLFDGLEREPIVRIGGVSALFVDGPAPGADLDEPAPGTDVEAEETAPVRIADVEEPAATAVDDFDDPALAATDEIEATPRSATRVEVKSDESSDPEQEETLSSAPAKRADGKRKASRKPVTAESLASQQRDISVSEFFAKNRHLLGFDNKRKALLTTVKEAVDNSLDACEEAQVLPEIHVTIDQLAEERFRVTVRDNGPGIVKAQVPNIFGKLLYGSKFHRLKMSRGQQGIGISAAGMYGLLTTGKPIHVTSRTGPKKPAHHFQIAIDTAKNKPDVMRDEEVEVAWERGTEVTIELVASFAKGRQSVDEYIEQTAIANPHARVLYKSPAGEHREFPRASDELPAETREIKPHPYGIELGVLMKLLKDAKPARKGERTPSLSGLLQREFSRVTTRVAHDICAAAKLSVTARPTQISAQDAEKLYQAMQRVKIMAPPTDCLAPIGVRNLLAGICKEVKAEFYTASTRNPAVYRGNPFQIEAAVAYGGTLAGDQQARVIRFANRVPLLYQQSACSAFKSVLDVDWRSYGLSQPGGAAPVGPLVVMLHMASVWVPFTSESKEAIADYDEIRKEMKLALQECGRKLAAYVRRRRRQRLEADRRNIFERYIPDVAEALVSLSGASEERLLRELQRIARSRTAEADVELDEDGKPIDNAAGRSRAGSRKRASAGGGGARDTDTPADDELAADGSIIIVPENEAPPESASDLFDSDPNNGAAAGRATAGGRGSRAGRRRRRR